MVYDIKGALLYKINKILNITFISPLCVKCCFFLCLKVFVKFLLYMPEGIFIHGSIIV